MSTTDLELCLQGDANLATYHVDIVNEFSAPALSERTRELYAQFGARFLSWCSIHDYPATLPVQPNVVVAWLSDLASDCAVSTVGVALAAIKFLHAQAGVPFPSSGAVANAMSHIRRRYGTAQDQAKPLTPATIGDMLRTPPQSMVDVRDYALLATAYVFALRRSELVGLDMTSPGDGGGVLSIEPEALRVTLHRSKESQEAPETVSIPRQSNHRALGAIDRWIRDAGVVMGSPVFRAISARGDRVQPRRLTPDMASRALRRCVARHLVSTGMAPDAAEAEAALYSGHSGRVGFVVAAVEAGANHDDIAKITRHAPGSPMIRRYGQQADMLRTSPHKLKGVGL